MSETFDSRYAPRALKAKKILAVLQDFLGSDLSRTACLDLGCSTGDISTHLAPQLRSTVGVDLNETSIRKAQVSRRAGLEFLVSNGQCLPFAAEVFDLVICAQIYEHVEDKHRLQSEIWRVLRRGGVCFFSGPNRLAVMEEHYWLPFLSWLPGPLASLYLAASGRGENYDIRPLLYWQLRRLWRPFVVHDYTVSMIRDPERFAVKDRMQRYSWQSRLPRFMLELLEPFFPNYNWILVKSEAQESPLPNRSLS